MNTGQPWSQLKRKVLPWLLVGVLVLSAAVAVWVYVSHLTGEYENRIAELTDGITELNDRNSELQSDLSSRTTDLADVSSKLDETSSSLADAQAQLEDTEADLTNALAELAGTKTDLDLANQTVVSLTTQLDEVAAREAELRENLDATNSNYHSLLSAQHGLEERAADLEAALICEIGSGDVVFEPNYSSNAAMSSSLKAFIEELHGTVDSASWEVIWTNTRSATHKVHWWRGDTRVMSVFVVFFDDGDYDIESVFWADKQCWLDAPIEGD